MEESKDLSKVWKSDQNCSALISNADTDQCWSEKNTQNWSALISNSDADQCWSEHVGGVKYWVCWCFVGTNFYSGYMVINSKGKKGCESPICLWVTRWLLIFFGSCAGQRVVSSLCRGIWYPPLARLYYFNWLMNIRETVCFRNGIHMSGLRLRRGRWTSTITIDLLICNTRNKKLIHENEANIVQLAIANCWSFWKFSPAQRFK